MSISSYVWVHVSQFISLLCKTMEFGACRAYTAVICSDWEKVTLTISIFPFLWSQFSFFCPPDSCETRSFMFLLSGIGTVCGACETRSFMPLLSGTGTVCCAMPCPLHCTLYHIPYHTFCSVAQWIFHPLSYLCWIFGHSHMQLQDPYIEHFKSELATCRAYI